MNPWDRFPRYVAAPKKPPPEHGIRVKRAGTTWWGERWIEALERMSREYAKRVARGRSYARAGRTHDLAIEPGVVRAKVTGSRATPYAVTIRLAELDGAAWDQAIAVMAEKAQFAAELLAGSMPREIEAAFDEAGTSLFPSRDAGLETSCSCPDSANPCKHIAATHYVLGEAFDRDPFLLFEFRGRKREQVLDALRAARGGVAAPRVDEASPAAGTEPHATSFAALDPSAYDAWAAPPPALHLSFEAPPTHGALLRQLGMPRSWRAKTSPAELLSPWVHAAAERARKLALAEGEPPESPEPNPASSSSEQPSTPDERRRVRAATGRKGGKRRRRDAPSRSR